MNNLSNLFNGEPVVSKVVEIEEDEKGLFHIKSNADLQMILDLGKMKVKGTTFSSDFTNFDRNFVQEEGDGCEERSHHWQNEDVRFCMSDNGTFYSLVDERDFNIDSVSVEWQYKDDENILKIFF